MRDGRPILTIRLKPKGDAKRCEDSSEMDAARARRLGTPRGKLEWLREGGQTENQVREGRQTHRHPRNKESQ